MARINCTKDSEMSAQTLLEELAELERELDWQVNHKRIAYLQKRIAEIEAELKKRTPIVAVSGHGMSWAGKLQAIAEGKARK